MKLFGNGKLPKGIIIGAISLGVAVALAAALTVFTYANKDIFPGVTVDGISLGGKNLEEATAALTQAGSERYDEATFDIVLEDVAKYTAKGSELGVKFSSAETAENAMKIGHEGGFFARIGDVAGAFFGARDIAPAIEFDELALEDMLAELTKYDIAPVDADYTIENENTLVLHPKADGKKLNTENLIETVKSKFAEQNYEPLEIARDVAPSVALDMDKVYSEVHKEVADAHLENKDGGNIIVPHVVGVDYDLEAAKVAYQKNPDEVIRIPLTLTQPKVLTKHLEVNLFKYCLSEVTTRFSPKKVARTANVRLSAKLINGTILNPGEEFSYNKTVGPRTKARGFQEAAIFAQGEVVDGIGGGICQTSSTLYMAAVKANMKTTQRSNHSFYVDYAPKGEDATVVYGSLDFKFKNTSKYPIKIVATSQNNWIKVRIMGTEPDEVRTVKLTKTTHSTTPYTTREKISPDLKAGERKVEQKGQPGLSMTVYRNVYDKNGKLVESYVENKSKYKPMPEIVLVGAGTAAETTAPAEPPATTTPAETKPAEPGAPKQEDAKPAEAPAEPAPAPEAPAEPTPAPSEPSTEAPAEPAPEAPAEPTPAPEATETPAA